MPSRGCPNTAMPRPMHELRYPRPCPPPPARVQSDQLFKMASVLGTPTPVNWQEGLNLAAGMNFRRVLMLGLFFGVCVWGGGGSWWGGQLCCRLRGICCCGTLLQPAGRPMPHAGARRFPSFPAQPLAKLLPTASPDALELIGAMCSWDPARRPTATQALAHPYFQVGLWPGEGAGGGVFRVEGTRRSGC